MVALAESATIGPAYAAANAPKPSVIQTVSYTTGAQGAQLKWLPYRTPAKTGPVHVATRIAAYQVVPPARGGSAGTSDPFQDPFGDANQKPQPAPPMQIFNGDQGQQGGAAPALPDLSQEVPDEPDQAAESSAPDRPGRIPLLDEFTMAPQGLPDDCPSADELKPINEITDNITAEDGEFPKECPLADDPFMPRAWAPTTFAWKASGLCHKPLYFEDVHLERYGHSWGPYVQPVISGGHFFLTIPALPYFMTLYPPYECMYTLGYYRPGSCAPYMLDPLPVSVRAGLVQAAAWTGAVFLIP